MFLVFSCATNIEAKLRSIINLRCGLHVTGFCYSFRTKGMERGFSSSSGMILSPVLRERKQKRREITQPQGVVNGPGELTEKWQRSQNCFCLSLGVFTQLPAQLTRVTSASGITKGMIVILLLSYVSHPSALHFLTHSLVWILKHLFNVTSLLNKL